MFSFNSFAQQQVKGFVANAGQFRDSNDSLRNDLLYSAEIQGAKVYITKKGLHFVYASKPATSTSPDTTYRMDMEFYLANVNPAVQALGQQTSYSNYFIKNSSIPDVKEYETIKFTNLWPNINLELTSDTAGCRIKYTLAPGANAENIKYKFVGGSNFVNNSSGLSMNNPFNNSLNIAKHTISQNGISKGSAAVSIVSNFDQTTQIWSCAVSGIVATNSYTVQNIITDRSGPSIPEPIFQGDNRRWGTYYGGSAYDGVNDVFVTNANEIIACGQTQSLNFPFDPNALYPSLNANTDAFVVKFYANRSRAFSTYFGGNFTDVARAVTVSSNGDIYFAGYTNSNNYPLQPLTGAFFQNFNAGNSDAVITRLSADGLYKLWSTYQGGSNFDEITSIGITTSNEIYVVGNTSSSNFPIVNKTNAFNQSYSQCLNIQSTDNSFIARFNVGNSLVWSTYYGGRFGDYFNSITIDANNLPIVLGATNSATSINGACGVYNNPMPVCGPAGSYQQTYSGNNKSDNYIVKFNSANQVYWASCYGSSSSNEGSGITGLLSPRSIIVNGTGDIIFISGTDGAIPMSNYGNNQTTYGGGLTDAYLARFTANGTLTWRTYLGGSGADFPSGIALLSGNQYLAVGSTTSSNFPTLTNNAIFFDNTLSGLSDGFQTYFRPTNNRYHSTLFGSIGDDYPYAVATDKASRENIIIVGETSNLQFPVKDLLGTTDYFDDSYNGGSSDGFLLNQTIPCADGMFCRVAMTTESNQSFSRFNIYPNPSANYVTIDFDPIESQTQITIVNLAGQIIYRTVLPHNSGNYKLDLSDYPKGTYTINFINRDIVETKLLMIQ